MAKRGKKDQSYCFNEHRSLWTPPSLREQPC